MAETAVVGPARSACRTRRSRWPSCAEQLEAYRPELRGTAEARAAARFLLVRPPLPVFVRPPYAVLAAAAVASLPAWTRWPLRLPYLPVSERTVVRAAGKALVRTLRWVSTPPPSRAA